MKMDYTGFLAEKAYRNYNSYYKYNPDGLQWNYETDESHMLTLTHSLSHQPTTLRALSTSGRGLIGNYSAEWIFKFQEGPL